jgi:hypothetical protein
LTKFDWNFSILEQTILVDIQENRISEPSRPQLKFFGLFRGQQRRSSDSQEQKNYNTEQQQIGTQKYVIVE